MAVFKQFETEDVTLDSTTAAGEDATGFTDWSIKNKFDWKNSGTWQQKSGGNEAIQITVNGYETPPNQDATGRLIIFPSAEGAGILLADTYGIDDPNGSTYINFNGHEGVGFGFFDFSYQWIRVDGATAAETNIGVDAPRYQRVEADIGNLIKVRVSFMDGDGYSETVTSLPFGPLAQPAGLSQPPSTLVSNTGQSHSATAMITQQYAMGFKLGNHGQGYEISSVSIELAAILPSDLTVSLWIGVPPENPHKTVAAYKLFDFTNPPSFQVGLNKFTAPAGAFAYQNVQHFIVLSAFGSSLSIKETTSDAEDADGETGAILFNDARVRALSSTGRWSTSDTSRGSVLRLDVEGSRRVSGILAANYAQDPTDMDGDPIQEIISLGDAGGMPITLGAADRYLIRGFSWVSDATTSNSGGIHNPFDLRSGTGTGSNLGAKLFSLTPTRYEAGINVWTAPQGATVAGSGSYLVYEHYGTRPPGIILTRVFGTESDDDDTPTAPGVSLGDAVGDFNVRPLMALLGEPLHAMVQNLGQADNSYHAVGGFVPVLSQGFTTSPNAAGYELQGIGVNIEGSVSVSLVAQVPDDAASVSVAVYSADAAGLPSAKLFDLLSPTEYAAGHSFFEAPAGTTLAASTSYVVVWSHLGGTWHRLQQTSSDSEDAGAFAGFSVADAFYRGANLANLTVDSDGNALEIAVYGNAITPPKRVTGFGLHSSNSDARGIWGNDDTFWVANDGSGAANKLYAYNRSDGSRDTTADFDTLNAAGNESLRGVCSDGATMFVTDHSDDKIYAYKMSDTTRDSGKDVTLASANNNPQGLWCDSSYLWVAEDNNNLTSKIFVYQRSDGSHVSGMDITAATMNPSTTVGAINNNDQRGMWSNGTTLFVVDDGDDQIYGYKLSDRTRDDEKNLSLDTDNTNPEGLWFDDRVLWVVDSTDDKVYVYDLPGAQPDNTPAAGVPTLDATPQQDIELTADVSGITDSTDGVDNVLYFYQWIRVDGADETELAGETGPSYTPTADDVGKSLKVRVIFDDNAGNQEYPRTSRQIGPVNAVTVPDAPTALTAEPAPDTTPQLAFDLSWTAPASDGSSAITKHQYRQKTDSNAFGAWTDILDSAATQANATSYTVKGLTATNPPTTFTFEVQAVNANGNSGPSNQATATVDVPARPDPPTATAGDQQITVSWVTPANNGSAILRYQYFIFDDTNENVFTPWTNIPGSSATTTSHTATGLTNGNTYGISIRAVNHIGVSFDSLADSKTPGTFPTAPRNLTAEPGDTQVRLEWTAPASNGGNTIDGYEYQQKAGTNAYGSWTDISGANANTTEHTVTGLTNGTIYRFKVRAKNPMGEGPASNEASATPVTVPSVPQNFTLTPGNGQVRLDWTAPASDGGNAILRYEYRHRAGTDSFTTWTSVPGSNINTTQYTVTGLTNGTLYTFEIRASTATTKGMAASETTTPMAVAPDAPRELSAKSKNTAVELTWQPPLDNGGSPITRYEYRQRTGNGPFGTWMNIPNSGVSGLNATSYTVTGLTNGTSYYFELHAVNNADESAASNEALGIPHPITTPDKPRGGQLSSGDGKVIVQWIEPLRDGGTPILHYEYCLRQKSQCNGHWVEIPDSAPGGDNHGLYEITRSNGTFTRVYLRAVNDQGAGHSFDYSAVPLAGAPAAPTNLRAEAPSSEYVKISWNEPRARSGVTIIGYSLENSRDGVTWARDPYCQFPYCDQQYL